MEGGDQTGTAGRGRPLDVRWSYAALLGATVMVIVYLMAPDMGSLAVSASGLLVVPGVALGVRNNRPAHLEPWRWLTATVVAFVIAGVFDSVVGPAPVTSLVYLSGYGCQVMGLVWILRLRRGRDSGDAVWDGAIVAAGTFLVAWITLIEPTLNRSSHLSADQALATVLDGLYQPLEVLLVFLLFRLMVTDTFRLASYWFLIGSASLALLSDLLYALAQAGHIEPVPVLADPAYVVAFGLFAAAALHPSMRSLTERVAVPSGRTVSWRIGAVAGSMLLPTVVLAVATPRDGLDRGVRMAVSLALVLAVIVRVLRAVDQHARAQQEMVHAAQHDPLTGLPNRGLLVERITASIYGSMASGRQTAVLFVDLDHFKRINDSLGHAAGDAVLRTVAARLRTSVPPHAYVGRISGDEFAVVATDLQGEGEAFDQADAVLRCFDAPISLTQGDLFVTASIGVAAYGWSPALTAEELLRDADTALYRAKDSGRSCAALFDATMRERVARRLETETALRRALERDELRLHYQPIVELRTGRVRGFEALVRWNRPDGVTSPAEFVPIAEDTGLIIPIGSWVLLEALQQLERFIEAGVCAPDASMSVNISPRQLRDERLIPVVVEAISRSGVDPGQLWLEVTESLMMSDPSMASSVLGRLCHLGVNVAIDDFGTGYSSLSHLKRYPIQRIKIDRSFISGLEHDDEDRSLVRTIVAMARSLGQDVVAEGIETPGQLQALVTLGCDYAQGFLFSRPVPAELVEPTLVGLQSSPHVRRVPPAARRGA